MTVENTEAEESFHDELRSTARSFFKAKMPLDRVADAADSERAAPERELWDEFVRMGWTGIMLPEDAGGAGAGLSVLAVLFEEFGRSLCPTPHFATLALAAPCIEHELAQAAALVSGESTFTLAWAEPPRSHRLDEVADIGCTASTAGGEWKLRGTKRAVPDAGSVSHAVVVARADDDVGLYLVDLDSEGARVEPGLSLDGTRRVYSLVLEDAAAAPLVSQERTRSVLRDVRRHALVLSSYEVIGLAERILEDIVAYANERHQFGKPIGAFQAVSGPLVDAFVEIELARALARWAVRAIELGDPAADVAAVVAKTAASDAAVDTVERATQVAGAIGFTWEYHLHRFLRRALWIASFDSTVEEGRQFVAAELLERSQPPRTVELMDTAEVAAFRTSVRAWIEDNLPRDPSASGGVLSLDTYEDVKARWRKAMCESENLVAHWPKEFGGRGASPAITAVFREEAIRAHPRVSHGDCGVDLVAPLLMEYGTHEQKERFLEPIRTEAEVWTQAFSEPNAGSDLASLETRARKEGNHWVLNGNKTWCTYAPVADWIFVLARTDPEATRHRGISCFLVDARSPGVEIRPIRDIAGTVEFGEIFFRDVMVPDADLVGGVNEGWSVAVMTLAHERVIESYEDIGELGFIFERLRQGLRARLSRGGDHGIDALVRDRLARLWYQLQAVRLVQYHSVRALEGSDTPPPESEIVKLVWSEVAQDVARLGIDMFAQGSYASNEEEDAAAFWQWNYMNARSLTIYAGTSEILRSVVAQRVLGLPRSR